MSKDIKKDKKTFTTLKDKIVDLKEEETNLLDSYRESHTDWFFLLRENCLGLEPK